LNNAKRRNNQSGTIVVLTFLARWAKNTGRIALKRKDHLLQVSDRLQFGFK
jgi:hypothetical protein